MARYKVLASSVVYYELFIEAKDDNEAWDIAGQTDGSDFKQTGEGDWQIDHIIPVDVYTLPKFEPVED